jgi:hypothetical protein
MRGGPAIGVVRSMSSILAGLVLAGVIWAAPGAAADPGPTARAETTDVALGQLVRVQGSNWGPPGSGVVQVVVCGNDAVNNSADCDLADTAEGAIRAGGTFFTGITIHAPPRPCPCLLRVYSTASYVDVKIPIRIAGVPSATPVAAPGSQRRLSLSHVGISGSGPMLSWFGAAPIRRVHFDVTNAGDVSLTNPPIDVTWGSGSNPAGFIAPPQVGVLAPGQTRRVSVAIPMHAVSLGTYTVVVKASPVGGQGATAPAQSTIIPWGWIAILLLVALGVILARRRARRRRAVADQQASPVTARPDAEPVGVAAGAAVAVDSLPPPPVLVPDRPDWAGVEADLYEAVGPRLADLAGDDHAPGPAALRELASSLADEVGRAHGLDDAAIDRLSRSLHEEFVNALQPATAGSTPG